MSLFSIAAIIFSQLPFTSYCWDGFTLTKMLIAVIGCFAGSFVLSHKQNNSLEDGWYVFLAAGAICTFFSVDPLISLCGVYIVGWETMLMMVICYLCYRCGVGKDRELIYQLGALAGLLAGLYGCVQYAGLDVVVYNGTNKGRIYGINGNPTFTGASLCLGIGMIYNAAKKYKAWYVALFPTLFHLYVTGARGAMISAIAITIYHFDYIRNLIKKPVFIALAFSLIVFIWLNGTHNTVLADKQRIYHNLTALRAFADKPLFGWGPGNFVIAFIQMRDANTIESMNGANHVNFHSHNLITNVLATQGVVGLFGWLCLGVLAWRSSDKSARIIYLGPSIVNMFSPIPPNCFYVMSLVLGAASTTGKNMKSFFDPVILCCGSFILLLWTFAMIRADHFAGLALRNIKYPLAYDYYFKKAHSINPLEWSYGVALADINGMKNKEVAVSYELHKNHPLAKMAVDRVFKK